VNTEDKIRNNKLLGNIFKWLLSNYYKKKLFRDNF